MTANFGGVDAAGEGGDQLWGSGRGAIAALQGAILACYGWVGGRGAIAGWHCSMLWWGSANFGGVDVVTLLGAIAGCQCSVLGEGRVTTNDMVPLQGAIVVCYGWGEG